MDRRTVKKILGTRQRRSHKLQMGRVYALVGSRHMPGAGMLVVQSALRMGAGKVVAAYPKSLAVIYQKVLVESLHKTLKETRSGAIAAGNYQAIVDGINAGVDTVVIGPGLGREKGTAQLVVRLAKTISVPLILDADGLNALSDLKKTSTLKLRTSQTVVTPHEGEMARLTGYTSEYISAHRRVVARTYAARWNSIVVLKGNRTVIADPNGRVVINKTGGPALATPGSGDVLSGMIATLAAQSVKNLFTAVITAVYLHGEIGDKTARELGERSVLATDLLGCMPFVLTSYRK